MAYIWIFFYPKEIMVNETSTTPIQTKYDALF